MHKIPTEKLSTRGDRKVYSNYCESVIVSRINISKEMPSGSFVKTAYHNILKSVPYSKQTNNNGCIMAVSHLQLIILEIKKTRPFQTRYHCNYYTYYLKY